MSSIILIFEQDKNVFNLFCKKINILFFNIPAQDMKLHHAGWDAYYTGYCFIKMLHVIKNVSKKT